MAKHSSHYNAVKHGAYATPAVLPGEDAREYERLYLESIAEWMPDGPTEFDAVATIAKCIWRKRRVQTFIHNEVMYRTWDPTHAAHDERVTLRNLPSNMAVDPEWFENACNALSDHNARHLRSTCPSQRFSSPSEWVAAVQNEIDTVLLPRMEELAASPGMALTLSADVLGEELFKTELVTDERLDAMIDRAVKRLAQTNKEARLRAGQSLRVDSERR